VKIKVVYHVLTSAKPGARRYKPHPLEKSKK
jgi:hypothetical protein